MRMAKKPLAEGVRVIQISFGTKTCLGVEMVERYEQNQQQQLLFFKLHVPLLFFTIESIGIATLILTNKGTDSEKLSNLPETAWDLETTS